MRNGDADEALTAAVREEVARQGFRDLVGFEVAAVGPGYCELVLDADARHDQQQGYVHGGVVATLADVAAGCAAIASGPPGTRVLTVEFKLNYLRAVRPPARLRAVAHALRAGRSVAVLQADVHADDGTGEVHCATALFTYSLTPPDPA